MQPRKILCYGDSNTYGFAPRGPQTLLSTRYDETVRWPRVLQSLLGDGCKVEEQGQPGRTVGYYGEGETYASGLALIGDFMKNAAPVDLAIVMLGSNDLQIACDPDVQRITDDLQKLLQVAQKPEYGRDGTPPRILLVSPPAIGPDYRQSDFAAFLPDDAPALMEQLRQAQHQLAGQMGVAYYDAAQVARATPYDGLHMDADSHKALGAALAPLVREILA